MNVVVEELVVVVDIRCAEVKRKRGGAVVLADAVLNIVISEMLQ